MVEISERANFPDAIRWKASVSQPGGPGVCGFGPTSADAIADCESQLNGMLKQIEEEKQSLEKRIERQAES